MYIIQENEPFLKEAVKTHLFLHSGGLEGMGFSLEGEKVELNVEGKQSKLQQECWQETTPAGGC